MFAVYIFIFTVLHINITIKVYAQIEILLIQFMKTFEMPSHSNCVCARQTDRQEKQRKLN